jgi:ATP-dependent DNA ligase
MVGAEHRTRWVTMASMQLPLMPPVAPMLSKAVPNIPEGDFSYEPKWDGFRSIVFRDGDEVEIGSRNERPMTRYFPEIVLSIQTPASFISFDLLALDDTDYSNQPFEQRRAALEEAVAGAKAPIHLTPATRDHDLAVRWFSQFEGAGLDGVVAKPLSGTYQPDKRTMFKIKHERTADCVVAGYRLHKSGPDSIGSLLLGLYKDSGELASVGVIGAFPAARRKELFAELQPLVTTFDDHPWAWAKQEEGTRTPRSSEFSRWNAKKDLSFIPLRPELVVEVRYEHMEGDRFRHTAQFNRWRPDRDPRSCTYEQLEEPVKYDLGDILSAGK